MVAQKFIKRFGPGFLRHVRRRWLQIRCLLSGVCANPPVYTVVSSNRGRSVGDVFLALASMPRQARPNIRPIFITHPNHAEVVSWFAHRLGCVVLSHDAENWVAATNAQNIHWHLHQGPDPLPGGINNPWRFFIHHQVSPLHQDIRVRAEPPQLGGKCVILIPERGDNSRLGSEHLGAFVNHAIGQGYRCYTNGHINTNFSSRPPLPGTHTLPELSLRQLIAITRDPEVIFVGTRCGLFDILYFMRPPQGSPLVILYPHEPEWIMEARFIRPDIATAHSQFYDARANVHEFRVDDFSPACFNTIIPSIDS